MDTLTCKGLLLFINSIVLLIAAIVIASAQGVTPPSGAITVPEPGIVTLLSSLTIPGMLLLRCRR